MQRGYVKIWRKIEDSGLIQLPNTLALFIYILLNATHKERKVGTHTGVVELKRGEFLSGRKALATALNQSEQQIRTSLDRLVNLEILSIIPTNKYSIYAIENYSKYQDNEQQSNQELTNKQPADNQQITTKQTLKHLNNKNTYVGNDVADDCPHQEIIDLYHTHLPMLTRVKVWNVKRRTALKARWHEDKDRQNLDFWNRLFQYIANSDFLTGKSSAWQCDLEWIVNSSNFIKIIEGKYENKVAA